MGFRGGYGEPGDFFFVPGEMSHVRARRSYERGAQNHIGLRAWYDGLENRRTMPQ